MYREVRIGRIMYSTVDANTKVARLMDKHTYRFGDCCEQSANRPLGLSDCYFFSVFRVRIHVTTLLYIIYIYIYGLVYCLESKRLNFRLQTFPLPRDELFQSPAVTFHVPIGSFLNHNKCYKPNSIFMIINPLYINILLYYYRSETLLLLHNNMYVIPRHYEL